MQWIDKRLDTEYVGSQRYCPAMPALRGSPLRIVEESDPSLMTLVSHSWFFRVRTVQESALARECQVYFFFGGGSSPIAGGFEFVDWSTESTEVAYSTDTERFQRQFRNVHIKSEKSHSRHRSRGSWHTSKLALTPSRVRLFDTFCYS